MPSSFEASVRLLLVDGVSRPLGAISRAFAQSGTAAAALQSKLNAISGSFSRAVVFGAGGAALAMPLIAATKAATEYTHQLNQMATAGMSQKEIADSVATAWETSSKVLTSSVNDNLRNIKDLRSVLGSTQEARAYNQKFATIQGAYAGILDGKLAGQADNQTFAMAKAIDMLGKVKDRAELNKAAEGMFRVTEATLGRVLPSDYQQAFKYARQARYGLSDEYMYKVMPELILENKTAGGGGASAVGTQQQAFFKSVVQGFMTKKSAEMFKSLGLANSSALKTTTIGTTLKSGLLGADIATANPLKWVNEVLVPRLAKMHHISMNDKDKLVQYSNQLFTGNRLTSSLVAELIRKPYQYERFGKIYDKTKGIQQAYDQGIKNDPEQNYKALGAAFNNLRLAVGENIVPVLIPAINAFASTIKRAGAFLHNHPGITKALVGVNALAVGALASAAALNVLNGSWGLLKTGAGLLNTGIAALGTKIPGVTPLIGRLGTAIGAAFAPEILIPAAVAIGAIGAVMANWKNITKFVNDHQKQFIHVAAEASRMVDRLSTAFKYLMNWMSSLVEQISIYVGAIPGMKDLSDNLKLAGLQAKNAFLRATAVDDVTIKRDEKYFQGKGMAGLVDAVKGNTTAIKAASIAAPRKTSSNTTVNYAPHIEVHAAPNIDARELVNLIDERNRRAQRNFMGNLGQAVSASGGANSVGRSGFQGGATRP